jgi:hypothetical protein
VVRRCGCVVNQIAPCEGVRQHAEQSYVHKAKEPHALLGGAVQPIQTATSPNPLPYPPPSPPAALTRKGPLLLQATHCCGFSSTSPVCSKGPISCPHFWHSYSTCSSCGNTPVRRVTTPRSCTRHPMVAVLRGRHTMAAPAAAAAAAPAAAASEDDKGVSGNHRTGRVDWWVEMQDSAGHGSWPHLPLPCKACSAHAFDPLQSPSIPFARNQHPPTHPGTQHHTHTPTPHTPPPPPSPQVPDLVLAGQVGQAHKDAVMDLAVGREHGKHHLQGAGGRGGGTKGQQTPLSGACAARELKVVVANATSSSGGVGSTCSAATPTKVS